MAKPSKTLVWVVVGAVAVYGVVAMTEPSKTAKAPSKTGNNAGKKASDTGYTDDDYKYARNPFPSLSLVSRNAFMPLVYRKGKGSLASALNGVPTVLTGGESGWFFTGIAVVDGRPTALLENTTTGEGKFLAAGESWKATRVAEIGTDSVVFNGPSGIVKTLQLQSDAPTTTLAPARVALSGPIGGVRNGVGASQDIAFGAGGTAAASGGTTPRGTTGRRGSRNNGSGAGNFGSTNGGGGGGDTGGGTTVITIGGGPGGGGPGGGPGGGGPGGGPGGPGGGGPGGMPGE